MLPTRLVVRDSSGLSAWPGAMEQRGGAQVPLVLLATSRGWAEGDPRHGRWTPPSRRTAWPPAGSSGTTSASTGDGRVVAVRSTWDYDGRRGEFLGWASGVGPALLNGVSVFRWNTDKRYLIDLQQAACRSSDRDRRHRLRRARRRGQVRARRGQTGSAHGRAWRSSRTAGCVAAAGDGHQGPWVVQPLVDSIHRRRDVGVRDRRPARQCQVQKMPSRRDIPRARGIRRHVAVGRADRKKAASLAASAVATVVDLLGEEIVYARVDMMRYRDQLVVSEVELTEPGLYLDVLPLNAAVRRGGRAGLPRAW